MARNRQLIRTQVVNSERQALNGEFAKPFAGKEAVPRRQGIGREMRFRTSIHEELPNVEILLVTEHDSRTLACLPSQRGVRGYVEKSRIESDLIAAVRPPVSTDLWPKPRLLKNATRKESPQSQHLHYKCSAHQSEELSQ